MESRYSINTSAGAASEVDQLLAQFEEENLLSLQMGSHRAGAGNFEAFASDELTPSYLQDEDGGLDKELVARLAALKGKKRDGPQGGKGDVKATSTAKLSEGGANKLEKNDEALGPSSQSGRDGPVGRDVEKAGSALPIADSERDSEGPGSVTMEDQGADSADVETLGNDLASRLQKLKGQRAIASASQTGALDASASNGQLSEADRYSRLVGKKEKENRAAPAGTPSEGQRTVKQDLPSDTRSNSAKSAGTSGVPYVDLSRGKSKQGLPKSADQQGVKQSWSNPLAGLFGRKQSPSMESRGHNSMTRETAESDKPDEIERRARALLVGVSDGLENGGPRKKEAKPRQGFETKVDQTSALYQDMQGVIPRPDQAYDEVLKEEQSEVSEVEALLAAMHDDVRIRKERRAMGLDVVGDKIQWQSQGEALAANDTESNEELGSEMSEEAVTKGANQIADWAVDCARLEGLALESGEVADEDRRGAASSSEEDSHSEYELSSDEESCKIRKRKVAIKKPKK